MSDYSDRFTFADVEKEIRKKTFGIISVVDTKQRPHTTGIIFGVSVPEDPFYIYMVTLKKSAKVRYIKQNPNVSFMITFPHHFLTFIPDSTVMMRGTADLISLEDEGFKRAMEQKRMLKPWLETLQPYGDRGYHKPPQNEVDETPNGDL